MLWSGNRPLATVIINFAYPSRGSSGQVWGGAILILNSGKREVMDRRFIARRLGFVFARDWCVEHIRHSC